MIPKEAVAKPFVKYLGGKRASAPAILDAFGEIPCTGTYYEPFVGGGAVFFALHAAGRIRNAVLSDTCRGLILAYTMLQNAPENFIRDLQALPSALGWEDGYYAVREKFNADQGNGVLFTWLSRACFNGLVRFGPHGFNSPVGKYKTLNFDFANMKAVHDALPKAQIMGVDWTFAIEMAQAGDWIYADPPYLPLKKGTFVGYSKRGFAEPHHTALATALLRAAKRGVKVVASNADLPVVREVLYPSKLGWHHQRLEVRRSINRDANGRAPVGELLITWEKP